MTNLETLKLLLQPNIKTAELARLIGKGRGTASRLMSEMHQEAMKEGLRPVRGYTTTDRVIKKLGIDLPTIINNARLEKEFGIGV